MILLNHLIKDHLLYEGLIHSVSRTRFVDMFERWSLTANKFNIVPPKGDSSKIVLQTYKNITSKELNNLLQLINNLGWFISSCMVNTDENDNSIANVKWKKFEKDDIIKNYIDKNEIVYAFQCEPKFDLDVSDSNLKTVYHITPSINDIKIKRIGLIPKSLKKISYHPERIYFAESIKDLEFIAERFHAKDKKISEYSIYEINLNSAMKDNSQLRLFIDPNFEGGIYTLSNIHPSHLTLIKKINVNT